MLRLVLLLLLLTIIPPNTHAQTNLDIDSLKSIFSTSSSLTNQLEVCQSLVRVLVSTDSAMAEYYIREGLLLAKQLSDQEASLHFALRKGDVLFYNHHYKGARAIYQQVLDKSQQADFERLIAMGLHSIGNTHYYQGENTTARAYFEKSLVLYQSLKDQGGIAYTLIVLGTIHHANRNYSEALTCFKKSLNAYEKSSNYKGIAYALNNIGAIYDVQGNYVKALSFYKRSLKLKETLNDQNGIARALNNIGIVYDLLGDYEEALIYHLKSADLYQKTDEISDYVSVLNDIGHVYLAQYKEEEAAIYYERVFSICKDQKLYDDLIYYYRKVGEWYSSKGRISTALDYYYNALKIAEDVENTNGLAEIYGDIAILYQSQQSFKEALNYRQKSLTLYQKSNFNSGIASAKNAIGALLKEEGNYEQALSYSFQALTSYQQLGDSCQLSTCFLTIGSTYRFLSQVDSAFYYLEQVKQRTNKCQENTDVIAQACIEMGKIYHAQNQQQLALTAYEDALKQASIFQHNESMKMAAEYLYPIYEQKGLFQKALATFKLYEASKDSLFNEANTRNLVQKEMEYAYEKEEQRKEIIQQKKDIVQQRIIERQEWITYSTISICLVLIILAFVIYYNYQGKQKANILLQKQHDEISRQKEELETLDHVKSQFFTNISHELRTPLTLIGGPIKSLLQTTTETFKPTTVQKLRLVERNTQQLNDLVNDILDLSKLESKKLALQEKEVAILSLLRRVTANFDSLAQHLSIRYEQSFEGLADTWLLLDGDKLEKILNNLLSNAIKHTPSKGKVTLVGRSEGEQLCLEVIDTGKGIPVADLPHIFDRFFQSKQPDAPLQGGTGVGLALAKELSHLMGGSLSVQSEEGLGCTFRVELPYKETPAPEQKAEEELSELTTDISLLHLQPIMTSKKMHHVLIVEDHPDMQRFIASLLVEQYHIHLAVNGKEALELLTKEKIDFIISDVMMPEMDGYALLQALKESDEYQKIPIVMLTALNHESNRLKALTIGVDDYLTKPFSPQELLARVHNLIERYDTRKRLLEEDIEMKDEVNFQDAQRTVSTVTAVIDTDMEWLEKVQVVMQKELENDGFRLSSLADQFHLSERQFQRKIKKLTGLTPKQYQQEIALQKARGLLETSAYENTTAIAYAVGMNHVTRFSKLYEARFGKKPSDYFS